MTMNISVIGSGMINPVGVGVLASAAATRAGINQYADSSAESECGDPIKVATVPDACLPELALEGHAQPALYQRMLQLGVTALKEALASVTSDEALKTAIPVFLALPEQRCGQPFPALEPLLKDLSQHLEYPLDLLSSRVFAEGRAAGFKALSQAYQLLENSHLDRIIVGGIDSYFDMDLLQSLDAEKRMLGDNSADGFVPGEGAAFIILEKTILEGSAADNAAVVMQVPSEGQESGHLYSDEPCLGNGLTAAISGAIENAQLSSAIQSVLCSVNGESLPVKEWSIALTRNAQAFDNNFELVHPAENYGDLGAATVPTLIALAMNGVYKGYLALPMLVWSASDHAPRGAVLITSAANNASQSGDNNDPLTNQTSGLGV